MKSLKMKIGYFADGPWSHRALSKIFADETLEVVFICARYDNPDPILREIASNSDTPFLIHPNINSKEFTMLIAGMDCDLFISMSFNQIFRKQMINFPRLATINCHAGKLPSYRGRNVLNWALINDEKEFGITVHYVDEGVDTGDILLQEAYPITDDDNYHSLLGRAYLGCADLLYLAIKKIQTGTATRTPQASIHPVGFYCPSRRVGDEFLNWNLSSRNIFNFVRAICYPGPQARTSNNGFAVKINRVELIDGAPSYIGVNGAVLQKENGTLLVKTGDSFIRIVEWSSETVINVGDRFN